MTKAKKMDLSMAKKMEIQKVTKKALSLEMMMEIHLAIHLGMPKATH
jgi:hypothetical protein